MTPYTFIAETATGRTIREQTVAAPSHAAAYRAFWNGLSQAERDACACVECLDEVVA